MELHVFRGVCGGPRLRGPALFEGFLLGITVAAALTATRTACDRRPGLSRPRDGGAHDRTPAWQEIARAGYWGSLSSGVGSGGGSGSPRLALRTADRLNPCRRGARRWRLVRTRIHRPPGRET